MIGWHQASEEHGNLPDDYTQAPTEALQIIGGCCGTTIHHIRGGPLPDEASPSAT